MTSPPTGPPAARAPARSAQSLALAVLQRIGRSLMMPIAVLPAAAILLRLGQDDLLGAGGVSGWRGMAWMEPVAGVVGTAGAAIFQALPLLFAVGVAIGFARRADGSTALAAVVGYLVFDRVSKWTMFNVDGPRGEVGWTITTYPAAVDRQTRLPEAESGPAGLEPAIDWAAKNPTDVLGGIVIGLVTALLWQRYHRIRLPAWLGFFGGRRFVPIVTALAALVLGALSGVLWPVAGSWIQGFGEWIVGAGAVGAGVYGMVNRLLLPFGLHHIVNSFVWFVFGTYEDPASGEITTGEISRYYAGDPTAGGFLSGYFPVLMFGLPGAAVAIWLAAHAGRRAAVGSIMVSAALTAFLTGITEPIEYAFIFAAPLLFAVHVVLTGVSMAVLNGVDAHLGFGFSAGLIDMVLNSTKDNTSGLGWILLVGAVYFVLYLAVFYLLITRLDLPTPGREPVEDPSEDTGAAATGPDRDPPSPDRGGSPR